MILFCNGNLKAYNYVIHHFLELEVFNGDNEWVFNQVMTETILQQEYIRERERANWGWNRGVVDFSKQGSCIL